MNSEDLFVSEKIVNPIFDFLINSQYNARESKWKGRIVGVLVTPENLILSCVAPLLFLVERVIRIAGNIFGKILCMKSCSFKNAFQNFKNSVFEIFVFPFAMSFKSLQFGVLSVIDPKNAVKRTFPPKVIKTDN